jgi:pimeloyl-ACP methyl ester carboxylesterase
MTTPTIVMLHGQPDSSASFWGLRRALQAALPGVRVLAPDRPGYGANVLSARDYAGNVRWLFELLQEAGAGPTLLLGHSWAGGVATLAAAQRPEAVDALVLLSSVGPSCLQWIDPVLGAPLLGELIAWSTLQLGKPLISKRAQTLIIQRQSEQDRPFALASGLAMRHRPVWRSFLAEQRALLRDLPAIEASLADIGQPTLVLSGQQDQFIPAATPTALEARISHAVGHRIDGGHDLQLRQPAAVAELVTNFAADLLKAS